MTPIFALPGSPIQLLILLFLAVVVAAVIAAVVAAVNSNNKQTANFGAPAAKSNVHSVFTWATSTFVNQIAAFRASIPATASASEIFSGYAIHFSQYLDALRSSIDANACPPEYRDHYLAYVGYLAQSLEYLYGEADANAPSAPSEAIASVERRVAELQQHAGRLSAIAQRYSL